MYDNSEFHAARIEEYRKYLVEKMNADIQYNIMMGNLDDPELMEEQSNE